MRNRTAIALGIAAVVGWAIAVYAMFTNYSRSDYSSPHSWSHPVEQEPPHEHATDEGPPVIKLDDLTDLGFDSATLTMIEPHFHVLNAALVTLVELHERYKSAKEPFVRRDAQNSSVTFHQTADRHERMIEMVLNDDLKERFHDYMLRREAEVGLHPDPAWHVHG